MDSCPGISGSGTFLVLDLDNLNPQLVFFPLFQVSEWESDLLEDLRCCQIWCVCGLPLQWGGGCWFMIPNLGVGLLKCGGLVAERRGYCCWLRGGGLLAGGEEKKEMMKLTWC